MKEFLVRFTCRGWIVARVKYAATASIAFAKVALDYAETEDEIIIPLSIEDISGKRAATPLETNEHDTYTENHYQLT
jgi:hypothetical protein